MWKHWVSIVAAMGALVLTIPFVPPDSSAQVGSHQLGLPEAVTLTGTGTSADDPFVIKGAPDSKTGIRLEYVICARLFHGYKRVSQRLIFHKGKPLDILLIRLADGNEREVFFDVSDFFGKRPMPPK